MATLLANGRKSIALTNNSLMRSVQLHTGDPGADGQANKYGSPIMVTFGTVEEDLLAGISRAVDIPEFAVEQGITITHTSFSVALTSTIAEASVLLDTPVTAGVPTILRITPLTFTVA